MKPLKWTITDRDLVAADPYALDTQQIVLCALQRAGAPVDGTIFWKLRDGFKIVRCYPGDYPGATVYEFEILPSLFPPAPIKNFPDLWVLFWQLCACFCAGIILYVLYQIVTVKVYL